MPNINPNGIAREIGKVIYHNKCNFLIPILCEARKHLFNLKSENGEKTTQL